MGFLSSIKDTFFGGAEDKAGRAQIAGIDSGIEALREQLGLSAEQFDSFINAGNSALGAEGDLLGLNGRDAEQAAIDSQIESPGQAFLRKRGERAVTRNAAATGGLQGGNVLKALQREGIGAAATQLQDRTDRISRVADRGLSAVGQVGAIRSNAGSNLAGLFAERGGADSDRITNKAAGRRSGLARVAQAFI